MVAKAYPQGTKAANISSKRGLIVRTSGSYVRFLYLLCHGFSLALQKPEQGMIFEEPSRLQHLHIGRHAILYGVQQCEEESAKFRRCLMSLCGHFLGGSNGKEHTTIRRASTTSASSLAALTRDRARKASSRFSKSPTTGIHASPTSVSSNVVASVGGMVKSDMRLDKGFSILCMQVYKQNKESLRDAEPVDS